MSDPKPITSIERPGVKAEGEVLETMQREVRDLLGLTHTKFPGAQPVSFSKKHLDALKRDEYVETGASSMTVRANRSSHSYYVCEKSDGIRYLLYATHDGKGGETHYLIDRRNDYWFLEMRNLHLPLPNAPIDRFHTETLVDGELVWDSLPDGKKEPRYLIFDCLVMDGNVLIERSLDKRLAYIQEHLYRPYQELLKRYPDERQYQPFHVEMKPFQFSYGILKMFKEILPSLKHGNDGLIFTCRTTPYQHGTDQGIVKWKPPDENSIDFRLRLHFPLVEPDEYERQEGILEQFVDYDSLPKVEIQVWMGKNNYRTFEEPLHLTEQEWETLKGLDDPLNDRIIECYQDSDKRWRMIRFRDDKDHANHQSTVDSVYQSIIDRISEADLIREANEIREKWKQRAAEKRKSGQAGRE